jgi:hypothetical protein
MNLNCLYGKAHTYQLISIGNYCRPLYNDSLVSLEAQQEELDDLTGNIYPGVVNLKHILAK